LLRDCKSLVKNYDMATKLFKLSTVLQFQGKSHRKAGDGLNIGEYQFFTSSQYQTKWFDKADYKSESIILGTGGVANIHYAKNFSTSADVFVLVPKSQNISIKYVYFYLSGNKHILERGFKGVGLKHLSRDYTEKIEIPFPVNSDGEPDLPEQLRIVDMLDEVEDLKRKRAEADDKASEIIPSIYSSFFKNKKFPKQKIEEIVPSKESIRTGPFGSDLLHSEFIEEGVPVLGIDNAVSNYFQWGKTRCLPQKKYEKFKRFRVYPRDVLVTIMGTVGRVCVTPEDLPECMSTKHLCVITQIGKG
jgi:type I restriction enzyme S subunit